MKLFEELPTDHHLSRVYRVGAGLTGLTLLVFGSLGFADQLGFADTHGRSVAGLSSNGALSLISVLVGLLLLAGAAVGGNLASNLNIGVGTAFLVSGLANLCVMRTDLNYLAFRMSNVIFSFVVGMMVLTFGMYGRVSGTLPHDNPYWRQRHQEGGHRDEGERAGAKKAGEVASGRR